MTQNGKSSGNVMRCNRFHALALVDQGGSASLRRTGNSARPGRCTYVLVRACQGNAEDT